MKSSTPVRSTRGSNERGFALVAVLLVLALLGLIGAEFGRSMRIESLAVRAFKESTIGIHLAEAALAEATREILADSRYVGVGEDGELTFYDREARPLPRPPRKSIPFGGGAFSYRITDEQGRLNINVASRERLERLLQEVGLEKEKRDVVLDSLADWRDPNDTHRANGAESEDTYLKLSVPYRAGNANLSSTRELLQIKGIDPALLAGLNGQPGLEDLVTVKSIGSQVNINTAPRIVLLAVGLAAAQVEEVQQTRLQNSIYTDVSRFGAQVGQAFTVRSQTFRIEAEGLLDGRAVARYTAVVQRQAANQRSVLTVREWRP